MTYKSRKRGHEKNGWEQISVYFERRAARRLEHRADALGLSLSAFLRTLALRELAPKR